MVFKSKDKIETRPIKVIRQMGSVTYISEGVEVGENVITKIYFTHFLGQYLILGKTEDSVLKK
jgi:phenolic acid decarboxylase